MFRSIHYRHKPRGRHEDGCAACGLTRSTSQREGSHPIAPEGTARHDPHCLLALERGRRHRRRLRIGLAAAKRFAGLGLKVCIADLEGERLRAATGEVAAIARNGAADVLAVPADVGTLDDVKRLEEAVLAAFGAVHVLMNNAGIQPGSEIFGPRDAWESILRVNLLGVIQGTQVFAPGMIARGEPGLIINTGSKQGITTPPGDPAYNVSKAGVKAFTEALQHDLRNRKDCRASAHLLIPGFVFTALTARGRSAA